MGRVNSVIQVHGLRYGSCLPTMWHGREVLSKGIIACLHFSLAESCLLPALAMMPDNSIPSHMCLVPFKLLLQHWSSQGMSASKTEHRPFKRNSLGLQKPSISLSYNPCWFLWPEVKGTSLPDTGTLGWLWGWCWSGTPCSPGGTSVAEIVLLIFISHVCAWDQPIPHLHPSYQSLCGCSFKSLVVGFAFS